MLGLKANEAEQGFFCFLQEGRVDSADALTNPVPVHGGDLIDHDLGVLFEAVLAEPNRDAEEQGIESM